MKVIETNNYIIFRHWFKWYLMDSDQDPLLSLDLAIQLDKNTLPNITREKSR